MQQAHAEQVGGTRLLARRVSAAGMLERALAGLRGFGETATCMHRAGELPPRLGEAEVVAGLLERRERFLGHSCQLLRARFVARKPPAHVLERAVQLVTAVTGDTRRLDQSVQQRLRTRHLAE